MMRAALIPALSALSRPGLLLLRQAVSPAFSRTRGLGSTPSLSPLATELLLARRRESHARESRSAEWREALARVRRACGVGDGDDEPWRPAAASLQKAAQVSESAAARLFGDDAAADAAELRGLLALMAGGGPKQKPKSDIRAAAALVGALAAAPTVVLTEGGTRGAAEVLVALRTRAQLAPSQALEAVERCPGLLGYAPERVVGNLLWLMGATAAPAAQQTTLLSALALGAPAALGRPPDDLRSTWEFLVGGGPAFSPEEDLRRWPGALERGSEELAARWGLAKRLGVRLVRPSEEEEAQRQQQAPSSSSSWRQSGAAPARAWVEASPDAIDRALGLHVGEARAALVGGGSGGGGGGGER